MLPASANTIIVKDYFSNEITKFKDF